MENPITKKRGDEGSALILALALILILATASMFLAQMSAGASKTSEALSQQRSGVEDAQAAITVAMDYVRYNYQYYTPGVGKSNFAYTPTAEPCLPANYSIPSSNPGSSAANPDTVSCTGSVDPLSASTRTVVFSACTGSYGTTCTSANTILNATVVFDDQTPTGAPSCNSSSNLSCGTAMNVQSWDLVNADS